MKHTSKVCRAVYASLLVLSLAPSVAEAISRESYEFRVKRIREETQAGVSTPFAERVGIAVQWLLYLEEHPLDALGVLAFNGEASPLAGAATGTFGTLTYQIRPGDCAPSTCQVDLVKYYVNADPSLGLSDPSFYSFIGESTLPNFALDYTLQGFEPQILGVPYFMGAPLFIQGIDASDNVAPGVLVAIALPEPQAAPVALMLALAFGTMRRRAQSEPGP